MKVQYQGRSVGLSGLGSGGGRQTDPGERGKQTQVPDCRLVLEWSNRKAIVASTKGWLCLFGKPLTLPRRTCRETPVEVAWMASSVLCL